MDFRLHAWRFEFRALDNISFPRGSPANVLRGALGHILRRLACSPECNDGRNTHRRDCIYENFFEPRADHGPSGLNNSPRPFVFRAADLNGVVVRPGELFRFDMHVFDIRTALLPHLIGAFSELADQGLGPGRGRAVLTGVLQLDDEGLGEVLFDGTEMLRQPEPIRMSLSSIADEIGALRVRFVTPTELKSENGLAEEPAFHLLVARARDRISTLRGLYGEGPLEIDFRGMSERASAVHMTRVEIQHTENLRRSTRTGQTHPLSGFVGFAEYKGDLGEFVPLLRVAQYTGVGRQTVWGKGEIRIEIIDNAHGLKVTTPTGR